MTRRLLLLLAAVALGVAGCGGSDDSSGPPSQRRTVEIDMRDISFSPDQVTVRPGEKVRFVFHNRGTLPHDAFLGGEREQSDHEREMRDAESAGHMVHGGDDGKAVTVAPGGTGELTYAFGPGDSLLIGCHQAGHYEAGMKVTVTVDE